MPRVIVPGSIPGTLRPEPFSFQRTPFPPVPQASRPIDYPVRIQARPPVEASPQTPSLPTAAAFALAAAAGTGLFGCSGSSHQQGAQILTQPAQPAPSQGWEPVHYITFTALIVAFFGLYFQARRFGLTRELDPGIDLIFFRLQRIFGLRTGPEFYEDLNELVKKGELLPSTERGPDYIRLRNILHNDIRKIPVVIGPVGSGKSHFLRGFAHEVLKTGSIPELSKQKTWVFRFSLNAIPSHKDLTYFGYTITEWRILARRVDNLVRKGNKVVVIVDAIHRFGSSGATEGTANDLMTAIYYKLIQWRENPNVFLTGATTPELYDKEIQGTTLGKYTYPLALDTFSDQQLMRLAKSLLGKWNRENVRLSHAALIRALEISHHEKIKSDLANPSAFLKIIDAARGRASRMASDGKENGVTRRDANGNLYWEVSKGMVEEAASEMFRIELKELGAWNGLLAIAPDDASTPPPPMLPESLEDIVRECFTLEYRDRYRGLVQDEYKDLVVILARGSLKKWLNMPTRPMENLGRGLFLPPESILENEIQTLKTTLRSQDAQKHRKLLEALEPDEGRRADRGLRNLSNELLEAGKRAGQHRLP